MLNKLLIKILKRFGYVQMLEDLNDCFERKVKELENIKNNTIVERNNILAEKNRQEYKLKNLECALIDMIENPHMVFAHPGSDNRYVLIDKKEMKANEEREIKFSLMFPENKVKVEVRE